MKDNHSSGWRNRLAALGASTILATGMAMPSIAADRDDSSTTTPIKHVVVIFPENRSFDHLFATYPFALNHETQGNDAVPQFQAREDTPAVNNLLSAGLLHNNPNIRQPFRYDRTEAFTCSLDHAYTDEQKSVDGGLMDKFVQATSRDSSVGCRADGSSVMGYFDGNTVTALWNYAQHFAMNDNSFDTTFGPSTPGALNLISGNTANAHLALTFAGGKVATFNPVTITGDADPALDDCGRDAGGTKTGNGTTELEGRNVGDLLNAKGITWGWFQGGFAPTAAAVVNPDGSTATPAVCASSHPGHPGVPNPSVLDGNTSVPPADIHGPVTDYSAHHQPFMYYASTRNQHHIRPASMAEIGHNGPANHQYDMSDWFAALQAGNLPAVSYLKPPAFQDDHPGNSDSLSFQTFLVDVVNALQQSNEWRETAVIISWDDSDGWYDHMSGPITSQSAFSSGIDNSNTNANDSYIPVLPLSTSTDPGDPALIPTSGVCGAPNSGGPGGVSIPRCGYGIRLPFLVLSPWSKKNFVSHNTTDQTSSLGFIEANWNLGSVDPAPTPVSQGGSFDEITGSIMDMFDFDDGPHLHRVILNDQTGLVVSDDDDSDHDRDHDGDHRH
jgi:phospholipase C